jgi:steroid 5-alpha reductase family enzyme
LAILLSAPFVLLAVDPLPRITAYEWAGFTLWLVAMGGTWVTDPQLKRHHVFGWLIWVAFFLAALETPYGAWTIFCPLLMLFFLRRRLARESETIPA